MSASARAPIAVNLLTGFLGSGKTSLLKRLLALPDLDGTAVIVNEFGEVGLDHLLVEAVEGEVVLLKSGCVCCSVRGDLRDGLIRLMERARSGEIPPFRRVVIETTGLADPVPVIASFTADPSLRYHFRLGGVVTVVDAVAGSCNLAAFDEAARQVAVADRLVVTKCDLAADGAVERLEARLEALNPGALTHRSGEDAPVPASILLDGASERSRPAADNGHGGHAEGFTTFTLTAEAPLDWAPFGLWLSMLLNRHGSRVLRLKGLLHLKGVDRPVVVQGVQHLVHKPEHLDAWPDGRPETRLVVIGRDLDPEAVRRSFAAFCR